MTKKSSKVKTHTKTRISKNSIKNTKKKVSLLKGGSLFGSTCEPTHKPYFKSLVNQSQNVHQSFKQVKII